MPMSFAPGWVEEHPDEYERLLAQRLVAPTPPEAWRAQFAACAAYLVQGAPQGAVTVPTTIIHGTADRIVPYANAIHTRSESPTPGWSPCTVRVTCAGSKTTPW